MNYIDLRFLGKQWAELTKLRTAASNRRIHLEQTAEALPVLDATVDQLTAMRDAVSKNMISVMESIAHPRLLKWQKDSKGIGAHLVARLLAEIGDPVIAHPQWWEGEGENRKLMQGEPFRRTPQQLFRYAGYGAPTDQRRKGMSVDEVELCGRPLAKSVLHLLSDQCVRHKDSPYRWVYDHFREVYADREGWTKKRQHNAAHRKIKRAILLDMWLTAQGMEPTYGHGNQPGKYRSDMSVTSQKNVA